jgi:hypothetical protein
MKPKHNTPEARVKAHFVDILPFSCCLLLALFSRAKIDIPTKISKFFEKQKHGSGKGAKRIDNNIS